jgi:response regulator RpfG family c-di-GMP phosphodiesterase
MSLQTFSPPTGKSLPLLIVDDEEIILSALQETLRRAGYEALTHRDPRAAIEELKHRQFSVIITDQTMPGMSGLELLAEARRIQPHATRILITAVMSLDTIIDAINKGEIYRFIIKPWLREEFLATVQNAVQRYELIYQNERLQESTQTMNEQLVELNRALEQQVKLVAQQNKQLAEMNSAFEQNLLRSMELCVRTMETFYPSLGNQARRASEICKAMAKLAQLAPEDRRVLESAALLQDIGLVGVPQTLVRKWQAQVEPLTPPEKTLIEQHPILGQELAAFSGSGLEKLGAVIRSHHEHFDGTGYPDQRSGENIPCLSRLLAVAVAYASSSLTGPDAADKIKLEAGTKFDPDAVQFFLRALPTAAVPRKEREVTLADLRPGMVLARGIYTANGLLLIPDGQQLNATFIEKILNHNRL